MSARFSLESYAAALRKLLPRGAIWRDDPDSNQGRVMTALAGSFERSDAAAVDLLADIFPATTTNLLPEWEASLGLPDACVGPGASLEQRRAQVVARLIAGGGLSIARYVLFAAELGFEIEVETYAPFRVGDTVGMPIGGDAWSFAWGVRVISNTSGLSSDVLLCELQAIKPAETVVFILP